MDTGILVPITLFAGIFGIVYVYFSSRNKERLALIDKGFKEDIFKKAEDKGNLLVYGFVAIGVGLGIAVGRLLQPLTQWSDKINYPLFMLIFGGLALVASYYTLEVLSKKKG
ncbi:hypothetical protein N9R81_02750 [Flavobacteriales bacterium]|nr:hypothetical protein [Flavobacteriales bacterium]